MAWPVAHLSENNSHYESVITVIQYTYSLLVSYTILYCAFMKAKTLVKMQAACQNDNVLYIASSDSDVMCPCQTSQLQNQSTQTKIWQILEWKCVYEKTEKEMSVWFVTQ